MAEGESFPDCLKLTSSVGDITVEEFDQINNISESRDFEIMAIEHKEFPIYGIQFQPESFATEGGKELIQNFLLSN